MFGIDVAQFRKSPAGGLVDNWLRTVAVGCSDDLVEHVTQVLVVMNNTAAKQPTYVLRGVSRSQTKGCASHGSVWLDDATWVLTPDAEQSEGGTNPRLLAAISHIDTGAALWVASAAPSGAKEWTQEFDELRGTIVLDQGLRASFNLKYRDADRAASAAQEFERTVKDMPPFNTYFEHLRAYAEGPWLQTNIVMSRDQFERFPTDPIFSGLFPSPPPTPNVVAADN